MGWEMLEEGMQKLYVTIFLRLTLGGMWLVSGGLKLVDLDAFVRDLRNYQFPWFDVAPGDMLLGYGLPWLELVVGGLLVVGVWPRSGYLLSGGMFVMFLIATSYAKYHGLQINCGCFGSGGEPLSVWHFVGLGVGLVTVLWLFFKGDEKLLEPDEDSA